MKLMCVGDINLGEYYPSFGHGPKAFANSGYVFSAVQPLFDQSDIVIGNLEAPITHRNIHDNEAENSVLKVDPDHANALKKAGFDILQVANNHTVQHSNEGFDDTISALKELGIRPVGLHEQEPVVIEREGLTVGFMAASDVPDNTNKSQSKYQRLDDQFIAKVKAEAPKYDHFIVMFHWGLEASTKPLPYQRKLAQELYSSGVSAIIGSHPHLFYEIEKRENFICAYSLGNFVFDLCWDKKMLNSGILELNLSREKLSGELHYADIKQNGCLPTPTKRIDSIEKTLVPYDLGDRMGLQQIRKVMYLLLNLHKGNTKLKIQFFAQKVSKLFRAT